MTTAKASEPTRVGLIGTGFIGQVHSLMLKKIAKLSEGAVRIGSVFGTDPQSVVRVVSRWPAARIAESVKALINDPAIDAVFVCTPTRFHREFAIAAARAGKHVFCEKPLAMSVAEACEVAAAVRAAGVIAQVGLVLRFSPVYNVIKEILAEATAGRILSVTMRDDQDFPTRGVHNSTWRGDPRLTAGGALAEHSIHDLDLLHWLLGPLAAIDCRLRHVQGVAGIEDFGTIRLEFGSGLLGTLTSVWHRIPGRSSNRRLEVFAENLYVACDDTDSLGPIVIQRTQAASESLISRAEVAERYAAMLTHDFPQLAQFKDIATLSYAIEDANFIAAIRGESQPYPTLEAGVAAQSMVEAAYRSAREGRAMAVADNN